MSRIDNEKPKWAPVNNNKSVAAVTYSFNDKYFLNQMRITADVDGNFSIFFYNVKKIEDIENLFSKLGLKEEPTLRKIEIFLIKNIEKEKLICLLSSLVENNFISNIVDEILSLIDVNNDELARLQRERSQDYFSCQIFWRKSIEEDPFLREMLQESKQENQQLEEKLYPLARRICKNPKDNFLLEFQELSLKEKEKLLSFVFNILSDIPIDDLSSKDNDLEVLETYRTELGNIKIVYTCLANSGVQSGWMKDIAILISKYENRLKEISEFSTPLTLSS